jgi:hypothetical protein
MTDEGKAVGRPTQYPVLGRLLQIAGVIVAIGIMGVGAGVADAAGVAERGIGLFFLFLAISIGTAFWNWGKRHLVPLGEKTRNEDRRSPIVYLRSFAEEETVGEDERVLAKIMGEAGPFVAIGKPGDTLPPLGASRFYVPDSDWKRFVTRLLNEAALVLVLAGRTPGLGWEIQQCKRRTSFRRLIVLVPNDRTLYREFRGQVETRTRIRLPDFPNDSNLAAGALAGLILFDEKWRGRWTPFERAWFLGSNPQAPNRNSRRAARLRKALSDACQRVGLAVAPPWLNLPHLLALLLIAVAIAGLTGMLIYALAGHH